ncbi:MAG: ABC transporter ATP-binding protein [Treponema sp.]|jgi:simple sugar transport system ATP-binding protein|nr:ABC transporter ATP-binding protein [Treponema sp.]
MNDYIVEMKNITKRFPGITANDDISVSIKKGEIFALLGENGAGKSTLMSILFGLYEPDSGEILVRGKKTRLRSSNEASALNIGMVHQHFKLVSNYTIAENIVLGLEPLKRAFGVFPYIDIKTAGGRIRKLSKTYGLEVDPDKRINEVNVSTQQRVEILKMLYREAEILIFDEPTAVLTPQEIEFLLRIMEELRSGGKTIILITHKLEEVKKIAGRCAVLRRGKLAAVLDVAHTSTREMAALMVGHELNTELEKKAPAFGGEVLRVENLTVRNENKFETVKNVSFSVRAGEIFAIAGVSGNGQVEIADTIAGLLTPYGGKIFLNGGEITHDGIRSRTKKGIAYIPEDRQSYGVALDLPLGGNLAIKSYYHEPFSKNGILNQESFEQYALALIEKFDIRSANSYNTITRSMSGGNQQKAIVAREISLDASLLVFVQPTRGLDIGAIDAIHRQMLAEREKGKAILLISLELDEIMSLADTIGVIYNGEMLKISGASELTTNEVGNYMMGVRA